MSRRLNVLLGVFFFIIFANSSHRLASIERAYYREDVRIGAMPAWFVLPVPPPLGRFGPPDAPSPRPPVVIVQHGFSASRQAMDWIVRGLVRNGFAVLAGDFRGHGQNPMPFNFGALSDDIASLIAYAQSRPEVDGQKIALVGHSMGAFAVYGYALQHREIDAVVPLSGSAVGGNTRLPNNVLLIDATGDPERIRSMSRAAMARLSGSSDPTLGVTYGDLSVGTARRFVEVSGNDHVTILFAEEPVREIVKWLRGTWGLPSAPVRSSPPGMVREGLIGVLTGLLVFFPLAGFLAAAILRVRPVPGTSEPGAVWMAGVAGLVAGVALFGGTPLSFMPFIAGNELASFFLIAGALYSVWLRWRQPPVDSSWPERTRAVLLGSVAFALIYATFGTAVARLFFNLTLDSQRFGWFVVVSILFLPLGIGLESALRPAGGWRAVVRSLAAKALILLGLTIAINSFGTLPSVIGLMIPSLAIILPIIEAVAARLYTVSGSALASGVLTALFLAWIPAAIFPIGY